jgi:hypothetical protein
VRTRNPRLRRLPILALAAILTACSTRRVDVVSAPPVSLRLSCIEDGSLLRCRALASVDRGGEDRLKDERDVTADALWSSSDAAVATVGSGGVGGVAAGSTTITASVVDGHERQAASVRVLVATAGAAPSVAFDIEGAVRDSSNAGVADVHVSLVDDRGIARDVVTGSTIDGLFRFADVASGRYRLRAVKPAYRPVEKEVTIPASAPLTLVLLAEPAAAKAPAF